MRDGVIEQVGSPEDVYHRAATRFVAGFIGSPAMNLIDAEIADNRLVFKGGDWLPVPDRFKSARNMRGRVALGLRADDVYPIRARSAIRRRQPAGRTKHIPVSVTEPLGNETLVFIAFGGRDWVTRMLSPAPL